jgi:hypothetical protein
MCKGNIDYKLLCIANLMSLVMIIMCAKLWMGKAFQVGEVKRGGGVTQQSWSGLSIAHFYMTIVSFLLIVDSSSVKRERERERPEMITQ